MLVLSRKRGEAIEVNGPAKIEIVQIAGNKVRVGITAPNDTLVMRSELLPPLQIEHEETIPLTPGRARAGESRMMGFNSASDQRETRRVPGTASGHGVGLLKPTGT